ncbi:MAG: BMP family ABC transporter substrate-binding protein [Clostridia bacterium]|nr:BMP family ABC transporter substrate-binding protein [Clostridia bacterium]
MKRIISLLLVFVIVFALTGCNGKIVADEPLDMSVAMVTDSGDITDQSFNQTTYEAAKAWCEENDANFNYYHPDGDDVDHRVASVDQAVKDGYNIILLPGNAFGATIVRVAEKYPDVKFILLDVSKDDILAAAFERDGKEYDYNTDHWNIDDFVDISNVYSAIYHEELSGYMAGYAAVMLGYENLGYIGGKAVPAVIRYGYGYIQGADDAARELEKQVTVTYGYCNQFLADDRITVVMNDWYLRGVEVIFSCGGGIWESVAKAASVNHKKLIGVDVDQKGIVDSTYGEGLIVTSAMKGLGATVTSTLDKIKGGFWEALAGNIATLGIVSTTDPTANYAQLPIDSTEFEEGKFTLHDYYTLIADMRSDKLIISSSIDAFPTTTNVTIDDKGDV